jgi:hypothetical protein
MSNVTDPRKIPEMKSAAGYNQAVSDVRSKNFYDINYPETAAIMKQRGF